MNPLFSTEKKFFNFLKARSLIIIYDNKNAFWSKSYHLCNSQIAEKFTTDKKLLFFLWPGYWVEMTTIF